MAMDAPLLQEMTTDLDTIPGVVVRQVTQLADAAATVTGCCYAQENRYKLSEMPDGRRAAREHGEAGMWQPSGPELEAMKEMMVVQEESNLGCRMLLAACGGLNLRAMRLRFTERNTTRMLAERPFRCGGCCGCPLEMTVYASDSNTILGRVEEDFDPYCGKCIENAFCCTFYTKVLEWTPNGALQHRYTLRTGTSCCGRVNNCCGATCCRNDLIIDVLDDQGKLVSTIQKTYGPGGTAACCRMVFEFSNFIVEFPEQATSQQRSLLLNAVFSVAYQLFERQGGDSNG